MTNSHMGERSTAIKPELITIPCVFSVETEIGVVVAPDSTQCAPAVPHWFPVIEAVLGASSSRNEPYVPWVVVDVSKLPSDVPRLNISTCLGADVNVVAASTHPVEAAVAFASGFNCTPEIDK